MDPKESLNHRRTRGAQLAPRCKHVWLNGRRCAAPALRGQSHCRFHAHIQPAALDWQASEPHLPFIEDATTLQIVINRVIRMINSNGPCTYKSIGQMLYALQLAQINLKAFMAEHPREQAEESALPQAEVISSTSEHKADGKDEEPRTLEEFLVRMVAKEKNGDRDGEALRHKLRPARALPDGSAEKRRVPG